VADLSLFYRLDNLIRHRHCGVMGEARQRLAVFAFFGKAGKRQRRFDEGGIVRRWNAKP
jgi:hypothetical protein